MLFGMYLSRLVKMISSNVRCWKIGRTDGVFVVQKDSIKELRKKALNEVTLGRTARLYGAEDCYSNPRERWFAFA